MLAMTVPIPGGPTALTARDLPDPEPGPGEVLILVAAAGVNRADIHQRQGNYPSPSGSPSWPGLEVSGTVAALGDGVTTFAIGDRVCALLSGGGYASHVVAPVGHVLPVPDSVDLVDAAGLPEVVATVWSNVFMTAGLRAGETLLVHGGSSGIGTMAIQLARAFGARVAVTAGSPRKLDACRALGADILVEYPTQDFVAVVLEATAGRGADVVLDPIGGGYLDRNLRVLAPHGRIALIANQSQELGTLDVNRLMARWGSIFGSTLRMRTDAEKTEIVSGVRSQVWPLVADGQVVPVIHERFPLLDVARAHAMLESSSHIGKLLLIP